MQNEAIIRKNILYKRKIGLLIGILGGFILSFTLWGLDGIQIGISHGYLPWVKFIPGTLIMIAVGGLCGLLSAISGRTIITALVWFIFGVFTGWIGSRLPFSFQGSMISLINPTLGSEVNFTMPVHHAARLALGWVVSIGVSMMVAFFFSSVLEGIWMGSNKGSLLLNLFFWIVFFTTIGLTLDNIYNSSMRNAIQVTHDTIQTARANEAKFDKGAEAAKLRILGLRPVRQLIHNPYQIVIKEYNDLLDTFKVWIDFDGYWVTCSIANGQVNLCK
jgi:hypothetical protein